MKKIETGKAINYGWETIKKDFWYFVAIGAIYMVLNSLSQIFAKDGEAMPLVGLLQFILGVYLTAGVMRLVLDYFDGKKRPINDLLNQGKYFWNVLGAQLLVGLIVFGGLILLIVPGIYWALKYQFVVNLIIDKDMSISEAMAKSGELTQGVIWQLLGFDLVTLGVLILGALALGVGIFVAVPIIWMADVYVYRHLLKG